jgi:hypothetical protein
VRADAAKAQKLAATHRAEPRSLRPVDVEQLRNACDVLPLDVDALAAVLEVEVANRVAAMVAYLFEVRFTTETERAAVIAAVLRFFGDVEASFVRALSRELGGAPVA